MKILAYGKVHRLLKETEKQTHKCWVNNQNESVNWEVEGISIILIMPTGKFVATDDDYRPIILLK